MKKLQLVTFSDRELGDENHLVHSCKQLGLDLNVIVHKPWTTNSFKIKLLYEYIEQLTEEKLLLVVDAFDVVVYDDEQELIKKFETINADVVFSSEANFYFRNKGLKYYYWKFYPRGETPYHYLNSGAYMGTSSSLKEMLEEMIVDYNIQLDDPQNLEMHRSDQYLFHKYYVDNYYKWDQKLKVKLDTNQLLFGCTGGRMNAMKFKETSWIQAFLFFRAERTLLKAVGLHRFQRIAIDYQVQGGRFYNILTETSPGLLHIPGTWERFNEVLGDLLAERKGGNPVLRSLALFISSWAFLGSVLLERIVRKINKGIHPPGDLFRFKTSTIERFQEVKHKILKSIASKEAVVFHHFNDGELTFAKKYLEGDHAETWFGRKQNRYSKFLGEKLLKAYQEDLPNYLVGQPCPNDHPELNSLAREIEGSNKNYVPAMSIHHNLSTIPTLISLMKSRTCYFIKNAQQSLDVFEQHGVQIAAERVIEVPFKNSYEKYDELFEKSFEPQSIVILTCGMLAKIIIPEWYKRNPEVSFLALGSSMDDFIQPRWNFRLFPPSYPFTHNYLAGQHFLFGKRDACEECFCFSN